MSSWWRRYAESLGATITGKSWRQTAIDATGVSRDTFAETGEGGWDRRIVTYFDAIPGTGPWARHLVEGDPEPVENGVVHMGDPVFYEGERVVHNG